MKGLPRDEMSVEPLHHDELCTDVFRHPDAVAGRGARTALYEKVRAFGDITSDHRRIALKTAIRQQNAIGGDVDGMIVEPKADAATLAVGHDEIERFGFLNKLSAGGLQAPCEGLQHFVGAMIRPIQAREHWSMRHNHEFMHRCWAWRKIDAVIAEPINRAAGIRRHCRGEIRRRFVARDPVDGGKQVFRRGCRIGIRDMKGAAGKARVTRVAVFRTPLEDVDLEATFRSGHRRRQTCETAANDR